MFSKRLALFLYVWGDGIKVHLISLICQLKIITDDIHAEVREEITIRYEKDSVYNFLYNLLALTIPIYHHSDCVSDCVCKDVHVCVKIIVKAITSKRL